MPKLKNTKASWTLWRTPDGMCYSYPNATVHNPKTGSWSSIQSLGAVEVPASDCTFVAALKLKQFYHGRSCHFYFEDLQTGNKYMMQGTEMEEILFKHTLHEGLICGKWGWVKRGGTISIKLLEELDDVESSETSSQVTS
jgi:hypothetical protein